MACRVHATHSYPTEEKHAEVDVQADQAVEAAGRSDTATATLEHTDELLDAIDEALGDTLEFAQEFVSNFRQKGGQ